MVSGEHLLVGMLTWQSCGNNLVCVLYLYYLVLLLAREFKRRV